MKYGDNNSLLTLAQEYGIIKASKGTRERTKEMMWYKVLIEDECQDFGTFAEAESFYNSYLESRRQDYERMGMLEKWEEDKKWLDLAIVKMEILRTPRD